ncbi:hypothetical protein, partial [Draconibacterium sp.]|uniref:hypothetical protein n=1 Tax=Draconibacterium sp. TaxID=1965318 RepID=UPI003562CEAB
MKRLDFNLKLFKITKVFFCIILVCLFSGSVIARGGIEELTSPDNNIKVRIELSDRIYYSVSANNFLLMEKSYLELRLKDQILGE